MQDTPLRARRFAGPAMHGIVSIIIAVGMLTALGALLSFHLTQAVDVILLATIAVSAARMTNAGSRLPIWPVYRNSDEASEYFDAFSMVRGQHRSKCSIA
jgi:hypothetical protein